MRDTAIAAPEFCGNLPEKENPRKLWTSLSKNFAIKGRGQQTSTSVLPSTITLNHHRLTTLFIRSFFVVVVALVAVNDFELIVLNSDGICPQELFLCPLHRPRLCLSWTSALVNVSRRPRYLQRTLQQPRRSGLLNLDLQTRRGHLKLSQGLPLIASLTLNPISTNRRRLQFDQSFIIHRVCHRA